MLAELFFITGSKQQLDRTARGDKSASAFITNSY
jgi:hypothetical protein